MLLFECNLWRGCISVTAMAQKSHKKSNIFRPTKFCLFLEISYSYKKNCKFLFQSNHCMQCENSPKILVHFKVGNAKNVRNWFLYSVIKYFEYSQKRAIAISCRPKSYFFVFSQLLLFPCRKTLVLRFFSINSKVILKNSRPTAENFSILLENLLKNIEIQVFFDTEATTARRNKKIRLWQKGT